MKRLTALAILLLTLTSCGVMKRFESHVQYPAPTLAVRPDGILEEVLIPSSEPGMTERRAMVYLPKDYYDSDKSYPVLYLFHGARGNELSWIEFGTILQSVDSLERENLVKPFILVLPNMNSYRNDKDFGHSRAKTALSTFFGIDGTVESVFVKDVVTEIDRRYRTVPEKNRRAIAGMSIGALQAIHISAFAPEVFGSVGLFSPMAHSFIRPGRDSGFYNGLDRKMKIQFADPPLDYKIMIGKADIYYLHMKSWTRKLSRKGYTHDFYVTKGGHEWYNWKPFAEKMMQESAALR